MRTLGRTGASVLGVVGMASAHPEPIASESEPVTSAGLCVMTPQSIEGPYYLDGRKLRSDIRETRIGRPLALRFKVVNTTTCRPVGNAVVDIWHCDAGGMYSGYSNVDPNVPPPRPPAPPPGVEPPPLGGHLPPVDDDIWLRGTQVTNRAGNVGFTTVFPGWYTGRTIHVHVKVYLASPAPDQAAVFTTQVYFDESDIARVHEDEPYRTRVAARDTFNNTDRIFQALGGAQNIMQIQAEPAHGTFRTGPRSLSHCLVGRLVLGMVL